MNDIESIAMNQLAFFAAHSGKAVEGFTPEALDAMRNYAWPGNLRELRNVIERAVILCNEKTIGANDLTHIVQEASEIRLGESLRLNR